MKKKLIKLTEYDVHNIIMNVLTEAVNENKMMKKNIIKIISPIIKGFHDDEESKRESWHVINDAIQALKDSGYNVECKINGTGYNSIFDDALCKQFPLTIEKDGIVIKLILYGNLCGTMENPYKRYDINFGFVS